MSRITHPETYDAPRSAVWAALTDSDQLAAWLMPNDFRPEVGHSFTFRTDPGPGFDGVVRCEVLVVDPPERLSYSWSSGSLGTVVTWTLEERPGGQTRLTLEHDGFRPVRDVFVRTLLSMGWKRKLLPSKLRHQLQSATSQ